MSRLVQLAEAANAFDPARGGFAELIEFAVSLALFGRLQEDLADELGVNPSSVSRWKTGKAKPHRIVQRSLAQRFATEAEAEVAKRSSRKRVAKAPRTVVARKKKASSVA